MSEDVFVMRGFAWIRRLRKTPKYSAIVYHFAKKNSLRKSPEDFATNVQKHIKFLARKIVYIVSHGVEKCSLMW